MFKNKEIISMSADQTQKIAVDLVNSLKGGEVIALSGDLGGGKTTFVQGLARAIGIKDQITSPTFVLIKEYKVSPNIKAQMSNKIPNHKIKSFKNLIHIDLYRLDIIDKVFEKQIKEYFKPENIVVIEWAEKMKDSLPGNTQRIKFDFIDENTRKIVFKS